MKCAVIEIAGSQFLVQEGIVIDVSKISHLSDKAITTEKVLMYSDSDSSTQLVGKPYLDSVTVEYTPIKDFKGKKIKVSKYHAKTGYSRNRGFRPSLTTIKINSIKLT